MAARAGAAAAAVYVFKLQSPRKVQGGREVALLDVQGAPGCHPAAFGFIELEEGAAAHDISELELELIQTHMHKSQCCG